jgi:hypothetical protein
VHLVAQTQLECDSRKMGPEPRSDFPLSPSWLEAERG